MDPSGLGPGQGSKVVSYDDHCFCQRRSCGWEMDDCFRGNYDLEGSSVPD